MPRVTYTTENGKKSAREFPTEEEARSWIEIVKDRQEEMAEDIAKIKEAVYNPDSGIYARIRELEGFKRQVSKVLWNVVTTLIGLGMHQVLSTLG